MGAIPTAVPRAGELIGSTCSPSTSRREGQKAADRGGHQQTLHPDKTRLLFFGRPPSDQAEGRGPATFDFLGFTHHWRRTRGGRWAPAVKTRTARLRRAITVVADYCRRHRHRPVKEQHASLKRRLVGHFNYFGVNGNIRSLMLLVREAERTWRKWLRRRSQRTRLTWAHFKATILRAFPLPSPKIRVQIWASP